jgi:hypothetical protein
MDLIPTDRDFLVKNVTSNSTVLYLGAGFSADASNRLGGRIPVGDDFCKALWRFLGYAGEYDGTALTMMFEAALKRKHSDLQRLLDDSFRCVAIPEWYKIVTRAFWMRIYTTNVDNLVEEIYRTAHDAQKLDVIDGITQDFRERDQLLETLQYVKLNGSLTDKPTSITFSVRQYADRLANTEVWYDQFVRDYSTRCTVFIGTKLDEPLLWQAVAARGKRYPGNEHRPKSFLISRSFSPAQVEMLKDLNVVPLAGTAKEFFELLGSAVGQFPSLNDVVLKTNPGLEGLLKVVGKSLSVTNRRHIEEFYSCFRPVRPPQKNDHYRSFFLLGSEPQWDDINNDLDAPRQFNADLVNELQECLKGNDVSLFAITGPAGSGKSTVMKRVAASLASLGSLVFFTHCEELPALHHFEAALDLLPGRAVLFFDNASLAIGILSDYLAAAKRSSRKHIFVIAGRSYKLVDRMAGLNRVVKVRENPVPDLNVQDVDNIIDVLERNHMLGQLANTPRHKQRDMFFSYAHQQILVAMRRATLGPGFDDIIKDEFLKTEPLEAKMLYLCAALVTEAQFTISKQQLIACIDCSPAETLALLHTNLRGVLVPVSGSPDRFTARHRVIAELIVERVAPRAMLKEGYINVLKTISHDLPIGGNTSSAIFRLYRRLINHRSIYERFAHHLAEARSIYSTVASFFSRDHHFWLQFGSLELEYGELDSAANYIEQAFKYAPHDNIVLTTRAQLFYKQSLSVNLIEAARDLRNDARAILDEQMKKRVGDQYPCHVCCTQELAWINRWLVSIKERKDALEELRTFANQAILKHSGSERMKEAVKLINDSYLDLAKPDGSGSGGGFNPVVQ